MIKIYGMATCPDCEYLYSQIEGRESEYDYKEIGSHVKFLKEFLKIRDNEAIFDPCRAGGMAGIPCFVFEDGSVSLTPEDAGLRSRAGLDRAMEIACEAFAGRTDKAGKDYFTAHLSQVAALVESENEKIIAFLHDILEDTDYPEASLRAEFGNMITDAVLLLTHKDHLTEEGYLDCIRNIKASGNPLAIRVKIADLTNNSDFTRLGANSVDELADRDRKRIEKYSKALEILGA